MSSPRSPGQSVIDLLREDSSLSPSKSSLSPPKDTYSTDSALSPPMDKEREIKQETIHEEDELNGGSYDDEAMPPLEVPPSRLALKFEAPLSSTISLSSPVELPILTVPTPIKIETIANNQSNPANTPSNSHRALKLTNTNAIARTSSVGTVETPRHASHDGAHSVPPTSSAHHPILVSDSPMPQSMFPFNPAFSTPAHSPLPSVPFPFYSPNVNTPYGSMPVYSANRMPVYATPAALHKQKQMLNQTPMSLDPSPEMYSVGQPPMRYGTPSYLPGYTPNTGYYYPYGYSNLMNGPAGSAMKSATRNHTPNPNFSSTKPIKSSVKKALKFQSPDQESNDAHDKSSDDESTNEGLRNRKSTSRQPSMTHQVEPDHEDLEVSFPKEGITLGSFLQTHSDSEEEPNDESVGVQPTDEDVEPELDESQEVDPVQLSLDRLRKLHLRHEEEKAAAVQKSRIQSTFLSLSNFLIVIFVAALSYYDYLLLSPHIHSLFWAALFWVVLDTPQKYLLRAFEALDKNLLEKHSLKIEFLAIIVCALFGLYSGGNLYMLILITFCFLFFTFLLFSDRHTVSAILLLVFIVLLVGFPLFFVIKTCVEESQEIAQRLRSYIESNPEFQHILEDFTTSRTFLWIKSYCSYWGYEIPETDVSKLRELILKSIVQFADQITTVITSLYGILSNVGNLFLSFLTFASVLYFLLVSNKELGPESLAWMSPFSAEDNAKLVSALKESTMRIFVCSFCVGFIHFLLTYISFSLCGIDLCLILSFLSGIASVLPIFSSWVIWLPASVGLLVNGQTFNSFMLCALQLFLLFYIDPLIYSNIPGNTTIIGLSIVFATYSFGVAGMLIGPLLAGISLTLLSIYKDYISLPLQMPIDMQMQMPLPMNLPMQVPMNLQPDLYRQMSSQNLNNEMVYPEQAYESSAEPQSPGSAPVESTLLQEDTDGDSVTDLRRPASTSPKIQAESTQPKSIHLAPTTISRTISAPSTSSPSTSNENKIFPRFKNIANKLLEQTKIFNSPSEATDASPSDLNSFTSPKPKVSEAIQILNSIEAHYHQMKGTSTVKRRSQSAFFSNDSAMGSLLGSPRISFSSPKASSTLNKPTQSPSLSAQIPTISLPSGTRSPESSS